jgi:hypothetical protein
MTALVCQGVIWKNESAFPNHNLNFRLSLTSNKSQITVKMLHIISPSRSLWDSIKIMNRGGTCIHEISSCY